MIKERRTEIFSIAVTNGEKKIIDDFKDKLQLVTKGKVSRADAVLKAIEFAKGKVF